MDREILQNYEALIADTKQNIRDAVERVLPREPSAAWLQENTCSDLGTDVDAWKNAVAAPFYTLFDREGKLFRPVLTCLTYLASDGDDRNIYHLAAVPEIIHTGSLIVDDVEDHSDMRRGDKAVHKLFGEEVAINSGSLLMFYAQHVMNTYAPAKKATALSRLVNRESMSLHMGQGMDIDWSNKGGYDRSVEDYLRMCSCKTGSLVRLSMGIGEVYAGRAPSLEDAATYLALGFQIQDDHMNLAAPQNLRKDTGEDIKDGKITYFVIDAVHHLGTAAERLKDILRSHTSVPEEIREAISLIEGTGALERGKALADEFFEKALMEIRTKVPVSVAQQHYLHFVENLRQRER